MAYVVVLLIAVAVAFPAGWLVCRAWLTAKGSPVGADSNSAAKHHTLLQAQRSRYRGQVQRVIEVVRRHEAARDQLRAKLAETSDRLDSSRQQTEKVQTQLAAAREEAERHRAASDADSERVKSTENAMGLLKIERDELSARVRRLEADARAHTDTARSPADADARAERGELREKLAAAEHRRHELETKLADRETRIEKLEESVETWKRRVMPLTRQVQTYREAVRKLQSGEPDAAAPDDDLRTDSLQQIKGIGPALERRLNAQGIQRFAQLAELAPVELADLADKLAISPTLPERDQWIEQARELAGSSDTGMATA